MLRDQGEDIPEQAERTPNPLCPMPNSPNRAAICADAPSAACSAQRLGDVEAMVDGGFG